MSDPRLGRRFSPDDRDKNFPVRRRLSGGPYVAQRHYWFAHGWWGDQGQTPQCVAYAWTHWLEDGPVKHGGPSPIIAPSVLYREAQKVDEWPGENYDGTSVRAGAKVLTSKELVSSYEWAFGIDDVIRTLLEVSPMVVGTNWYGDMFNPDPAGFIHVGGGIAGGHAYLLDGVSLPAEHFRLKNSWGRGWGNDGFALISFADFERLLREDGEAAIAVEVGGDTP